jgi:chromosomal replication initiator protein
VAQPDTQSVFLSGRLMNVQAESRWQDVLAEIRKALRKQQYDTWFKRVQFVSPGGEAVRLIVPNRFCADWLESNYRTTVEDAVRLVLGFTPQVTFAVDAVLQPGAVDDRDASSADAELRLRLNDAFELDAFVAGNCYRLAQAAARSVAECPGAVYNPLFVHGAAGMGKTHLLKAICLRYLALHPGELVAYVTADEFVHEFMVAGIRRTEDRFRAKYRDVSLLALDNVHHLANCENSQDALFHVFNELHSQKRQVVVAGDRLPKDIEGLSERLVSRLHWGLIVALESPDAETKLAILRRKAASLGLHATDDELEQIGSSVAGGVRELEGALARLSAHASETGKPISTALAREALGISVSGQ